MKKLSLLALTLSLSFAASSQTQTRSTVRAKKPHTAASRTNTPTPLPAPTPVTGDPAAEKTTLEEALNAPTPVDKAEKIQKFLKLYPSSADKTRALESLTVAHAAMADEKLAAGEVDAGVALFRTALAEAPRPYSDRFFAEVISRIPANLFWRGLRGEAAEAAASIEKNVGTNINQLLVLANYYVSTENGDEAKRLADVAVKLNPSSAGAYLVSGHANRLNFALEDASNAYSKALELDSTSLIATKGKAEMQRALGKPDAAAELYREILAKNGSDNQSRAGLVLSLFDAGKRAEAEAEMAKALEANSGNVVLLAGAAYWYAAQDDGAKAVELGQQAVAAEPRYIWSHIALARGLMAQRRPLDAERVLTAARKFGNFPTLEYEIASARVRSGFYGEAASELAKSFTITDGGIETKLGGRIPRRESSFADLIAYERRASIFEPSGAESPEVSGRLKSLLEFRQKLDASTPDETALKAAADEFIGVGDDKMKLHRQLYIANALLQKRVALDKVLELTNAALGNTDAALESPDAPGAVMANELYESRSIAFARGDYLLVPNVPKQTLSAILRGRVEEITGRALFDQGKYADAVVRLRRAVSVYPDKSAWQRSGMWHLGSALAADGKEKEAIEFYIRSYKTDKPDVAKYIVVENLYRKVNGTLEGLEAQIGPNPLPPAALPAGVETAAAPATAAEVTIVKEEAAVSIPTATPEAKPVDTMPEPVKTEIPVDHPKVEPAKAETAAEAKPDIAKEAVATEPLVAEPRADMPKPEIKSSETIAPAVVESTPATVETATPQPVATPEAEPVSTEVKNTVPVETSTPTPISTESPVEPAKTEPKQNEAPADASPPAVETIPKAASTPAASEPTVLPNAPDPKSETPQQSSSEPVAVETAEPQPVAQNSTPQLVVTDNLPLSPAESAAVPEKHYEVVKTDLSTPVRRLGTPKPQNTPARSKIARADGPLFEPIVITVPGSAAKNIETEKNTLAEETTADARPRVIAGAEVREAPAACKLNVSDDSVSVINDGGSVGVLVELSGAEKETVVTAASSSPENVDVKAEPENTAAQGRRFYIIRSVSPTVGLYEITFTAPCGTASVKVRVR